MKKFTYVDLLVLIIALVPLSYLKWVYDSLPAIVPMHYGADGKPNGFGPKSELFVLQAILTGTSIVIYLLMKFLSSIDPKKQVRSGEQTFQKLGMGIIVFFAALSIVITFATVNHTLQMNKLLLPLTGLLFVFLGNIMHSIKPNYFAGVRTPWTLEDEGNWRATHRLAGKVWVAGGIIITIAMLCLPEKADVFVFLPSVLVMAFIPVIYSYIYFKKHRVK